MAERLAMAHAPSSCRSRSVLSPPPAEAYATRARTPPSLTRSLTRSGSVAIETRIQPADLVRVRVSVSVSVRVRVTLRLRARLGFGLGLGFR